MGLVARLGWRNLFRQKRRNVLLGTGIACGMMVLVVAGSYFYGMIDVVVQDLITHFYGHIAIEATAGNSSFPVIREKERIEGLIRAAIKEEDLLSINELVSATGTAVGNGESDLVYIMGIPAGTGEEKAVLRSFFTSPEGDYTEFYGERFEFPVIISRQMAKALKVGVHDTIRVRLPMITGQMQTAKFTVVAVVNVKNAFMNKMIFLETSRLKKLLGYQPWEAAALQINLKDPKKTAVYYADRLHEFLQPEILSVYGRIRGEDALLLPYQNDEQAKEALKEMIVIVEGHEEAALEKTGVLISTSLAGKLKLQAGDEFTFEYGTKFRGTHRERFTIDAIYWPKFQTGEEIILVNEERVHQLFSRFLPAETGLLHPGEDHPFIKIAAAEWQLLPRARNNQELMKQYREEKKVKTNRTKYRVATMYEVAEPVLQMEAGAGLMTFSVVIILFFIILIGVVNTLRMTIRERTREIGTLRAIGMTKKAVARMFLLEILYLTVIAGVAGILLGVVITKILGAIPIAETSALSLTLKNQRLFFKVNYSDVIGNFLFIMFITGITAYFPARRAAKLPPAEALRHYE